MRALLLKAGVVACLSSSTIVSAEAKPPSCDIPREARDIWKCENGFVIGPENVIIKLPIPETDPEALYRAGLEAAGREDWRIAIAYFTAAHQRAHLVPRYMYNLGLAHARAGHHVPGIAWLVAYLIAEPDAPNRAAVWRQIETLESSTNSSINQVWDRAIAAARTLPPEGRLFSFSDSFGLQAFAARARDWDRLRSFAQEGETYATYPADTDRAALMRHRLLILRSDTSLRAAIEDGDLDTAQELAAEKGSRLPEQERSQIAALRDLRLLSALGQQEFAPEFIARQTNGCSDTEPTSLCSISALVRSGDQERARRVSEISLRALARSDHKRCYALAALGRSNESLDCLSGLEKLGFGGAARERSAASVGEIMMLSGDVANAERALRISSQFANGNTNMAGYNGAPHLTALLLAERGHNEAGVQMLSIEYSRNLSSRFLPSAWPQIRFDSIALLAEYVLNRGRVDQAVVLAANLDSIRRLAFFDTMRTREQDGWLTAPVDVAALQTEALVNASGGGEPPSRERRIAIENAANSALTISSASYDTSLWLEGFVKERNALMQVSNLAAIAEGNARALRRAHLLYQRAGGTWGR